MRVEFEATGIDNSVRNTQRLLYAMNAVRLSVRDIQDVMAGPTLQNVMWTAIQLTRVWTSLYRLINAANKEAGAGMALGAGRAASSMGGIGAMAGTRAGFEYMAAMEGGGATLSLWGRIMGIGATLGPVGMVAVGAAAATIGIVAWDMHQRRQHEDWRQRQREAAKSEGIEY